MSELSESADKLKAVDVVVAMLQDGRSRLGISGSPEMSEASRMGAAIWTPEEMLRYVEMEQEERHVFRNLKQTFKATVEFRYE